MSDVAKINELWQARDFFLLFVIIYIYYRRRRGHAKKEEKMREMRGHAGTRNGFGICDEGLWPSERSSKQQQEEHSSSDRATRLGQRPTGGRMSTLER